MKPIASANAARTGQAQETISFGWGRWELGRALVARSARGLCALLLGDDREELMRDLRRRFPQARLQPGDEAFQPALNEILRAIDAPEPRGKLALDARGTDFQLRVWRALQAIPVGQSASYTEVARRIGAPQAVRAVAGACAANPIAVLIPCHRVLRADGQLSGYRWGVECKRALLQREGVALDGSGGPVRPRRA